MKKREVHMNREQRRAKERRLKSVKGFSAYRKLIDATMKMAATDNMLEDGEKVKLDVDRITGRTEFSSLQPGYQQFVAANRDRVFTAKIRRRSQGGYPVVVDLEEDDTWSFWVGDLIRVNQSPSD